MRISLLILCAVVVFLVIFLLRDLYHSRPGCRVGVVDGGHFFEELMRGPCESALGAGKVTYSEKIVQSTSLVIASVFGNRKDAVPMQVPVILVSGEAHPVQPIVGKHNQGLIDTKPADGWPFPHLYLPFYVASFGERRQNKPSDLLVKPTMRKTKFCAYLASYDTDDRCRFFDLLTDFKKVDGLGTSRNTTRLPPDRDTYNPEKTYMDLAVEKYQPYQFVIAFENKRHQGYITEKIVSAMLAGCVPIYFGAPDVTEHFNVKSFVNVADFSSFEQCRDHVAMLENSPDRLTEIQRESFFPSNHLPHYFLESYLTDFVKQILAL